MKIVYVLLFFFIVELPTCKSNECIGPTSSLVRKLLRSILPHMYHGHTVTEQLKLIPVCSEKGCFQIKQALALKSTIMKLHKIDELDFDYNGRDYNFCALKVTHLDRILPTEFTVFLFADTYRTVLPLPLPG